MGATPARSQEPLNRATFAGFSFSLNEYLAAPFSGDSEFIELIWDGSESLESSSITLRDSRLVWRTIQTSVSFDPGDIIVLVQSFVKFSAGRVEGVHYLELSSWPALNNGGDSIFVAVDGQIVDSLGYSSVEVRPGVSLERGQGTDIWHFSTDPEGSTPGRINSVQPEQTVWPDPPSPTDLLISEIMFDPVADSDDFIPDQVEFLELLNTSDQEIDLWGLWLSSLPDESGQSDSLQLVSSNMRMAAGGVALIFHHKTSSPFLPSDIISGPWPSSCLENVLLIPVSKSLGLSNQGELLFLNGRSGGRLAEAWYYPALHHPIVGSGKGVSLERLQVMNTSQESNSYTSSSGHEGATPGCLKRCCEAGSPGFPGDDAVPRVMLEVHPASIYPEHRELPFQASITIRVDDIGQNSVLALDIFDQFGIHRRTLTAGSLISGSATYNWDGRDGSGHLVNMGFYVVLGKVLLGNTAHLHVVKKPISIIR